MNGGRTIKKDMIKKIEKILSILFKLTAYVVTFLLAFGIIFESEGLNAIPTNTLIVVCTLIIMAFTIPD